MFALSKLDDMIHWCSVATLFSGMKFVYVESFLVIFINPHCADVLANMHHYSLLGNPVSAYAAALTARRLSLGKCVPLKSHCER